MSTPINSNDQPAAIPSLRRTLAISLVASLVMGLFSAWIYFQLPEDALIPVHWNLAGEADRHGGAATIFLLPGMMAGMSLLFYFLPRIEPRRAHLLDSSKAYRWVWLVSVLMIGAIQIPLAQTVLGRPTSPTPWVHTGFGVLLLVIGNFLGKVRSNFMFGVRTPWTLSSELAWNKTHRLAGWIFALGGLCVLLGVVLQVPGLGLMQFLAAWGGVLIVTCLVYSYLVWRRDPNKAP